MRRRLEKYYLFCNSAFSSLLTMKFVRYICIYEKMHSKLKQKMSAKYVRNLRYGSYEPSRKSSRDITRLCDNLVSKHKGNRKHANDVLLFWKHWQTWHRWHACGYLCVQDFRFPPFVLFTRLCHESHVIPPARFPTWLKWTISKILDIFCRRFLFQLRVYFVVYMYRKFTIYFAGFFCSNLGCIMSYIYIGQTSL